MPMRTQREGTMSYIPPRRSDGTIQQRRLQLPWPKDRPFRILSIDGGGICGILPASILAELESRFLDGAPISSLFRPRRRNFDRRDHRPGARKGLTAAQARDVYIDRGGFIFPPSAHLDGGCAGSGEHSGTPTSDSRSKTSCCVFSVMQLSENRRFDSAFPRSKGTTGNPGSTRRRTIPTTSATSSSA